MGRALAWGALTGSMAVASATAHAAEGSAPVTPPPKAAAASAPSPKAEDAPKGTKSGPAPSEAAVAAPAPAPSAAPPPSAPGSGEGAPPSPLPPKVEGGPPPLYFVEPGGSASSKTPAETAPPPPSEVGMPPPPTLVYEPPLPPEPRHLVPETALWAGMRVAWFVPFGSLWVDAFDSRTGYYYRRRMFDDYASSGPAIEFDLGARLARRYTVFAIMEHAFLGSGSLDDKSYGGQSRGRTSMYGAGLRFSTDPTAIGFLLEIALGYREFRTSWGDGTELALTGGWLDARVGIGADIRVNRYFSLSPMVAFGGGTFGKARWSGPSISGDALDRIDDLGQYGTLSVQLGGHFDIH